MKKTRIATIVIVAAIIAVAVITSRRPSDERNPSQLQIACNVPLTGPLATYGLSVKEGVDFAMLEKPEYQKQVRFSWQDNRGLPPETVTVWQKQSATKPDVYVSGASIPQWTAIDKLVAEAEIPHFLWIFTSYINKETKSNLRCWVNYKVEAPRYLEFVGRKKPDSIAIIHLNLPHAIEQFDKIVIPGIHAQKIDRLFVERYDYETLDFKSVATKCAQFKPDLVILNGFETHIIALIRSLRPFNVVTNGNTICTYDLLDAAQKMAANEIEGLRVVAPNFNLHSDKEPYQTWSSRFQKIYGKQPEYTHAYAYDMASLLADSSQRLQFTTNRNKLLDIIRATDLLGVTGTLRFDQDGDIVSSVGIGVYRNGVLIPEDQK